MLSSEVSKMDSRVMPGVVSEMIGSVVKNGSARVGMVSRLVMTGAVSVILMMWCLVISMCIHRGRDPLHSLLDH